MRKHEQDLQHRQPMHSIAHYPLTCGVHVHINQIIGLFTLIKQSPYTQLALKIVSHQGVTQG